MSNYDQRQAAYWYCKRHELTELLKKCHHTPTDDEDGPNIRNRYASDLGYRAPEVAIPIIESWIAGGMNPIIFAPGTYDDGRADMKKEVITVIKDMFDNVVGDQLIKRVEKL